jgi:hypothetical protein
MSITVTDTQRLLAKAEERGFFDMLGSIDYMHWQWHNCPVGWHGQFTRRDIKHPTIILKVVASHDCWIWHALFGVVGSNNIINVLNQSLLFIDIIRGHIPKCPSLLMVVSTICDTISSMIYIPPTRYS